MATALLPLFDEAVALPRAECDVRDMASVSAAIGRHQPDAVIHAGALTDHQHPNASEIIETNIVGTANVAIACRAFGLRLVYLSTHYVYPGETGHYRETDATRPIGTYAWSKYAGEQWAATVGLHLIIRGSWYSPEKLEKMSRGALTDAWHNRERPADAAQKIATLVNRDAVGVYNIGGKRQTFAELCVTEGLLPAKLTRKELSARLPYPFPKDCSVSTERYDRFVARSS